jgi:double-stranded uracil-DNA glycosylase
VIERQHHRHLVIARIPCRLKPALCVLCQGWSSTRRSETPVSRAAEPYTFPTLPDYLAPDLRLVFVGINPGLYSVERGHYFARRTSRFWPAFSRSALSAPIRQTLSLTLLGPEHDASLLRFGIGFTDVVKVPSRNAGEISPQLFSEWVPRLRDRLMRYRPRVACFHGLTGYRPFAQRALGDDPAGAALGPQPHAVGRTRLFVVPNPSPANAHFTLDDQVRWYDRLAKFLAEGDDHHAREAGERRPAAARRS